MHVHPAALCLNQSHVTLLQETILHNVLDMQGLEGSPKGLFAGPEDNVMH